MRTKLKAWLQSMLKVTELCRKLFAQKLTCTSVMIYGATFCALLPVLCKDMKFSLYFWNPDDFESQMSYYLKQNNLRVQAASAFFESLRLDNLSFAFSDPGKTRENVDIDVTLITTSRHDTLTLATGSPVEYNPRYLTQTLWQFMLILNSTETRKLPWRFSLSVCNVDSRQHEEAMNVSTVVRYFQRYQPSDPVPSLHIKEKEKQDYAYCLEESLKTNPRYSFLVEDDAFPHPHLFEILYYILETRQQEITSHRQIGRDFAKRSREKDVLFYKLYHPGHVQGFWSLEPERIPELLSFASLCGTLCALLLYSLTNSRRMTPIWILSVLYFLLVAVAVGRPHLNELRLVWKKLFTVGPAPYCCTPGMLFPARTAPHWLNYSKTHECSLYYPKDLMLHDYTRYSNLKGFVVQPSLFAHIGLLSSLHGKFGNPDMTYYPPWFKIY